MSETRQLAAIDYQGAFALLAEMSQDFAGALGLDSTLERALASIATHVGAEAGSLWLVEESGRNVACLASVGSNPITGMRLSVDEGIVGRSVRDNVCQTVLDVRRDPHFSARVDQESGLRTRSLLVAPMSVSDDLGENWTYGASPFPPLGGGQRLVILRLQEGPILFCSFGREVRFRDAAGNQQVGSGLFAALSTDEGQSWETKRLITDDGPPRTLDGGGNTGRFTMSPTSAEPRGYLSICQAANRVIHLISSKQHYAFNLAWLNTPAPTEGGRS